MRDGEPSLRLDNSGDTPIQVPGILLPQTAQLETNERFRHGLNDFSQDRLVAVEITMLAVMNNITDKPNWHRKIFDETIFDKWRTEATAMPLISTKAWDWMMKELRDKAGFLEEHGFITTLDSGSPCAKGDKYVDDNTRNDLKAQVSPLIDVKDEEKDWHPNSDQKVLNLVHPSLFPLVYGCTQVLQTGRVGLENCFESCGKGVIPPRPDLKPVDNNVSALRSRIGGAATESRFSDRFQWLPAEVRFKESSDEPADVSVEITSYINNLHPVWHRGLYSTISKLIGKAVPMWNQMLVKGWHGRIPPRISVRSAENKFGIPEHLEDLWKDPEEEGFQEDLQKVLEYMAQPDYPDYDASKDDEEDEAYKNGTWKDGELEESSLVDAVRWKYDRICDVVHPDPGDNYSYQEWKDGKSSKTRGARLHSNYQRPILDHKYQNLRLEDEFRDQGLQVIVKLASIELTPENPSYDGGSWHLEGMLNEHIVATAIYYYDIENVSESLIDFRTAAELDDVELQYEQDEHEPLAKVFGIASGSMRQEPAIQHLGSLNCKDNRMIAFPNTLQHRVQPFKLLDPTRSGHRRFLVLWLVDPHYRIASTANVPPQQQHWVAPETVEKVLAQQDMANELKDMIREYANEGTMSLETAKELRLELMKERTTLMPHVEQNLPEYNLCEH